MTDALEKIVTSDEQPAIHPGCIRIIVKLGEMEGGGDFLADALPEWIQSLDATTRNPLVRETEQGAELAREMAYEAAKAGGMGYRLHQRLVGRSVCP
jgi:hypothetical protein